jgi:quaternary ammonium compound-resistance protein SugE
MIDFLDQLSRNYLSFIDASETPFPNRRFPNGRILVAWVLLVSAGLLEIVWAIALKYSDGFTQLWPSIVGLVAALVSFVLLTMALKSLPVGTAYAVWVGIGAVGVAITGMVALGESMSPIRLILLALILIGVAGLKIVES